MLTQKFWKKYFKYYDNLNIIDPYQELMDTFIQKLEIKQGEVILDAGAGTGNLGEKIEKAGGVVVGFDSSEFGLEIHRRKTPHAKLVVGSLLDPLPFSDNYFDKICSNNVIYALPKTKRREVLKELYRILKPGGKIIVSNVHSRFAPKKIYMEHVKQSIRKQGALATIMQAMRLISPTVRIFYYNALIKKENSSGGFDFVEPEEQKKLLNDAGFHDISENINTYAGQAIMNIAIK
jgi:ubiquinone/menaquinone biosynthesis C-methylase UbiE